jgi:ArsR family transcriptional regulator
MDEIASDLRLLSDPVRLRILRVLARHELAAGEVAQALAVAPSTVSKHLALLRDAGVIVERRDGRHVHSSVPPSARTDARWAPVLARVADAPDPAGDLARLDDVLRARREARDAGTGRAFVPGRSWTAWARALGCLVPQGLRVADLGCGDGALAVEIGRFAAEVVGYDRSEAILRGARALAERRRARNVRFETSDFASLPVPARPFDVAVFSQSLNAAPDPAAALASARRLLRPGGRVLVLDLFPHREVWVRTRLGHQHLGFAPAELRRMLRRAGFREVAVERVAGRAGDPFKVVLATGVRGRRSDRASETRTVGARLASPAEVPTGRGGSAGRESGRRRPVAGDASVAPTTAGHDLL